MMQRKANPQIATRAGKSRVRPGLYAAIGVLGALGLSLGAYGFTTQGHRWAVQTVKFQIDPGGTSDVTDDSEIEAIRRSFATWQSVSCSFLSFEEEPWAGQRVLGNDGLNRIFWVETAEEWPGNQGTLALTYTFFALEGDQRITDSDIVVNGANWVWTTTDAEIGQGTPAKVDVETVMFHEIGHFFGLDHSQDQAAAMFPSNNKLKQRDPADDDIAGICSMYSNGMPVPGTDPTGNGGPVGAPCQAHENCASSICIQDGLLNQTYCTAQCSQQTEGSCPAGFACEMTQSELGTLCLAPAPVDELCDQCSDGSHCASGLCVEVPNVNNSAPFCSKPCDPTPGQPGQCPSGYSCELTQQATTQVGVCIPNSRICDPQGRGGQNEPCFGNGECKPGHSCLEYYPGSNSGLNFCYGLCPIQFNGISCGADRSTCTAVPGRMNTAVCFTYAQAGEPCIPEVCNATSFCAYDENIGVDSALCYPLCDRNGQADCPANFSCQQFQGIPPLCVPNAGFKYDGDACLGDGECESGVCRVFNEDRLCTRVCATSDPQSCSPGLRCVADQGSTQGLCFPESFIDPDATDPNRNVGVMPGYCSCDTSFACDDGCDCDPECGGGGSCSCVTRTDDDSGQETRFGALWWVLGAFALVLLRRRR